MADVKRSQKTEILNWLQQVGKITPKEAIALCGCLRLSARIKDLREEGWYIVTERSPIKGAQYAVYRLLSDQKLTKEEMADAVYR